MRFLDENIRLGIFPEALPASSDLRKKDPKKGYQFKAYLENSAVETVMVDQQLPFTPLSFVNDSVQLRTMYRVNFVFNVFSETREEAIGNYDDLHDILQIIKPAYYNVNSQYIPFESNLTGLFSLKFKGLPKLSKFSGTDGDQDRLRIHLTNFSYVTNNDMGFIEIPYDGSDADRKKLFVSGKMRLLPISYKLTIAGRVLLNFEDTARAAKKTSNSQNDFTISDIRQKISGDDTFKDFVFSMARNLAANKGKDFTTLSQQQMEKLLAECTKAKNDSSYDQNGNKATYYWDGTKSFSYDDPPTPYSSENLKKAREANAKKHDDEINKILSGK